MKVLALLLLLLSPLLVASATHPFLSGRRYNANVLSREAGRGIQSTVVQIRGGVLGIGKAKAPSKRTKKKAAPSARVAKKAIKKSAPAAKKIIKKAAPSAPAAKKKVSIDFRERKVQIGERKVQIGKAAPSAQVAKKKFPIDFRERKVQIGLLASCLFCYPILTA
jgi:hypothetical protein